MSTTGRGTSMKFIASPRAGCRKERKCLFQRTGGRGEWFSHPRAVPRGPSAEVLSAVRQLAGWGLPASQPRRWGPEWAECGNPAGPWEPRPVHLRPHGGTLEPLSPPQLGACGPHLDALDPKAEGGRGADGLPPLHVPRLGHSPLGLLLLGRGVRVHLDHLLVHVLAEAGLLPGLGELLLQVGPAWEGGDEDRWPDRSSSLARGQLSA